MYHHLHYHKEQHITNITYRTCDHQVWVLVVLQAQLQVACQMVAFCGDGVVAFWRVVWWRVWWMSN